MSSAAQRKAINWPPREELANALQLRRRFWRRLDAIRQLVNALKAEANQTMHPSRRIRRFHNGKITPAAG
jgi:hypothetical protein